MSKLLDREDFGSKLSQKIIKSKDSLLSKISRCSGSLTSVHGSRFGRCVSKQPKQNDPGLVQSLSTTNSRIVHTVFNPHVKFGSKLPDLTQLEATDCIRALGISLDILDYEFNYASFWLLDILSSFVKYLQLNNFSRSNQITALAWFRFVLRCISVTGAPREEVFELLQEMFITANEIVQKGNPIPQPEEIKIEAGSEISSKLSKQLNSFLSSKSLSGSNTSKGGRRRSLRMSLAKSISKESGKRSSTTLSRKSSKTSSESMSSEDKIKNNLDVCHTIAEWIYQLFADRFVFSLVSLVYSTPSMLTPVDFQLDFRDLKEPRPEPVALALPSPKSKPKSPSKGKGKKSASSIDKGEKKKGRKSRASSKSSKTISIDGTNKTKGKGPKEKKTDKKETKDKESSSKKGKGDKGKKERKSETKEDKKKGSSVKEKEESATKSKKGKGKGKRKSSSVPEGKRSSRKRTKKSRMSSIKPNEDELKKASLEAKIKMFDRNYTSPEEKLELEKIRTKDLYILPLSEAVSKGYVDNLLDAMFPQEKKQTEKPKEVNEKTAKGKTSRKSSAKAGKKKEKGKKKKK